MIRVTVWNEFYHEQKEPEVKKIYPDGIHKAIADFLGREEDITVRTTCLEMENCGITEELLEETDVLIWWGHVRHNLVTDEVAEMVQRAVLRGMGMIFLHSAHNSKPFKKLMGTTCYLSWRDDGDSERLWFVDPSHPILKGVGNGRYIELEHEEVYSEPFRIPEPEKLILIGTYEGGEVFRSGCIYKRENGKIFYFQPGHESYKSFYDANVQKIIINAVRWAAPEYRADKLECPHVVKIK